MAVLADEVAKMVGITEKEVVEQSPKVKRVLSITKIIDGQKLIRKRIVQ